MFNLLTDPIIPIEAEGARTSVTLPCLYSRLCRNEVGGFPGLAAHQSQAWYQFLAQLGALAMLRGGLDETASDPAVWRNLLTELAPGSADTAWTLLVDDAAQPAFLQPPTALIDVFKPAAETPDALDVLVTAKNHDRKQAQARAGEPHLWVFALVTLQTAQGFSGRGNYGIARMNGGHSSRVLVDRRPGARWGVRVVRAIHMLLACRDKILMNAPSHYRSGEGLALTWLRDWDTDEPLQMTELDPFFIEVCRRVRLDRMTDGRIMARVRPASAARINAKSFSGNLGDPWVPIKLRDQTALTVSGTGFDYRLAQRILFGSEVLKPPLALSPLSWERNQACEIHMAVLVRGQGKTEGLHERIIPLPRSSVPAFDIVAENDDGSPTLAQLSDEMVRSAGNVRKVLRQAVLVYLQGPENPNFKKPEATSVLTKFDRRIDERFFSHLFGAPRTGTDKALQEWQKLLKEEALRLAYDDVWARMTPPSSRREKARASSEMVLYGGLRKRLPYAFPRDESKEIPHES